jgi:hypothetical protein
MIDLLRMNSRFQLSPDLVLHLPLLSSHLSLSFDDLSLSGSVL